MRIALITPYYLPSTRGNAVTVRRIEQQLQKLGCMVAVFSLESGSAELIAERVRSFSPDIVHAFNALSCGPLAGRLAAESRIPFIITMTGTDIFGSAEAAAAGNGFTAGSGAAALVFFSEEVRDSFIRAHPVQALPTAIIPQGVDLPENISAETPFTFACNFLLPAGVRAVKNLLFPFTPLAELQRCYPQTRLLLAGGVIEPEYAGKLIAAVAANPFARWLGEVAYEKMPALYNSAQVVLNSSLSEGGMANSLLEGMAYGRALLAADIEGNRSLVRNGENGFLYRDTYDFFNKAEMLLLDKQLRQRMGAAGREYVARYCSPALEAERYLELYTSCCR